MNRFKGLDLVDRVPEEIWTDTFNTVQEGDTKTIPKKKKRKKAKWFSEEDLQLAQRRSKRQRRKGKIYPTEWRVPENSKEREESLLKRTMQRNRGNNRMGRTRDLFKASGDFKGTFHAKMDTIRDKDGKDLTEAEEINKRWQEYTELYQKKLLMTKQP